MVIRRHRLIVIVSLFTLSCSAVLSAFLTLHWGSFLLCNDLLARLPLKKLLLLSGLGLLCSHGFIREKNRAVLHSGHVAVHPCRLPRTWTLPTIDRLGSMHVIILWKVNHLARLRGRTYIARDTDVHIEFVPTRYRRHVASTGDLFVYVRELLVVVTVFVVVAAARTAHH